MLEIIFVRYLSLPVSFTVTLLHCRVKLTNHARPAKFHKRITVKNHIGKRRIKKNYPAIHLKDYPLSFTLFPTKAEEARWGQFVVNYVPRADPTDGSTLKGRRAAPRKNPARYYFQNRIRRLSRINCTLLNAVNLINFFESNELTITTNE